MSSSDDEKSNLRSANESGKKKVIPNATAAKDNSSNTVSNDTKLHLSKILGKCLYF